MLKRVEVGHWSLEMLESIDTTRIMLRDIEAEAERIASRNCRIGNSPEAGPWSRTQCDEISGYLDELNALTEEMFEILREMDKKAERLSKNFI